MAFKLGQESRKYGEPTKNRFNKDDASIPGTDVIRKDLAKGISAEANMDGSIFISNKIKPDDDITWMGESYKREKGQIEYKGEWLPEGDKTFPWEQH